MASRVGKGMKIFRVFNTIFLILTCIICLVPFIHIIALSFSNNAAVMGGTVKLWPVMFTTEPYKYVMERAAFWRAFLVSINRVVIGSTINVFLTILIAYPLSKSNEKLHLRTAYVWFFFITMIF